MSKKRIAEVKEKFTLKYEADGNKYKTEITGSTSDKSLKDKPEEMLNKQIKILYRVIFDLSEARAEAIAKKKFANQKSSEVKE